MKKGQNCFLSTLPEKRPELRHALGVPAAHGAVVLSLDKLQEHRKRSPGVRSGLSLREAKRRRGRQRRFCTSLSSAANDRPQRQRRVHLGQLRAPLPQRDLPHRRGPLQLLPGDGAQAAATGERRSVEQRGGHRRVIAPQQQLPRLRDLLVEGLGLSVLSARGLGVAQGGCSSPGCCEEHRGVVGRGGSCEGEDRGEEEGEEGEELATAAAVALAASDAR